MTHYVHFSEAPVHRDVAHLQTIRESTGNGIPQVTAAGGESLVQNWERGLREKLKREGEWREVLHVFEIKSQDFPHFSKLHTLYQKSALKTNNATVSHVC